MGGECSPNEKWSGQLVAVAKAATLVGIWNAIPSRPRTFRGRGYPLYGARCSHHGYRVRSDPLGRDL